MREYFCMYVREGLCMQRCFECAVTEGALGEVLERSVCTGVGTAIRKLCSSIMERGADVTHLLQA